MMSPVLARICALLFLLSSVALAATPTSFCKCICFGDYKIIPLDAPPPSSRNMARSLLSSLSIRADEDDNKDGDKKDEEQDSDDKDKDEGKDKDKAPENGGYHRKTCNDCNKVFCLEQNLPECKAANDQDVSAQCFQRDSSKDEAVVFLFIFATLGLLSYAIVRPFADAWLEKYKDRQQYMPVSREAR